MKHALFLSILMLCALFLHLYKLHTVPPGFNADEAAYGYNAYSILKTGADEFGNKFPLRLVSFGDYKLPGYSYLTIPFVAFFGLNETTTRLPALISAILLIPAMYFLAKLLLNKKIALITALLTTFSPWIHILARHAHEAVPMTLFIVLSLIFLVKYIKNKNKLIDGLLFIIFISLSLFIYHSARIMYIGFMLYFLYQIIITRESSKKSLFLWGTLTLAFLIPFITAEINLPPERLKSLFLFSNNGIQLIANEMKIEFAHSLFSTKLFIGLYEFSRRYLEYFSTDFLAINGDPNFRFGFPTMAPITIVEYMLFIIGFIYLYSRIKTKNYFLIQIMLLLAPLPAALTWQEKGLNRAYFMIVPILLLVSLAVYKLWNDREKIFGFRILSLFSIGLFIMLTAYVWEFFFFHYPQRAIAIRSWQCGYKELVQIIQKDYPNENIYMTRENGQPYIYLLFYLQYPPDKYSKAINITAPDKYGFRQITGFDRFIFSTENAQYSNKKGLYVTSQAESQNIDTTRFTYRSTVSCGTEHMFELYTPVATTKIDQTK